MVGKFDKPMMKTAIVWSEMSYCQRGKVGAVLATEGRPLMVGYNGTATKSDDNICEDVVYVCKGCGKEHKEIINDYSCSQCGATVKKVLKTNHDKVIHAEQNVISFCAKKGISTEGTTLYVTMSPCSQCAKLLVQTGIKEVVYKDRYRDTSGIEYLKKHNVKVRQYKGDIDG